MFRFSPPGWKSLFSRFFGETAGKLRLLFDQIAQTRGVYLLDEFDAIGARRGDPNDVGEIRRVLNSVLAFMEEPNATDSLVSGRDQQRRDAGRSVGPPVR